MQNVRNVFVRTLLFAVIALALTPSVSEAAARRRSSVHSPHILDMNIEMTNNDFQSPALCQLSCFAATYAFSTVPFFTLDQPRSISLVYNGDRALPRPFVHVDIEPDGTGIPVEEYTMEVRVNGVLVTFLNGDAKHYFTGGLNAARLSAQFDGRAYATGVYPMSITVAARWEDQTTRTTTINTELMIVNEASSPVAKGWSLAGVQRMYFPAAGGFMISEGNGTAVRFTAANTLARDFTRVISAGGGYVRIYPDSSLAEFSANGLLQALVDPDGRRTQFTYEAGKLIRVTEPMRSAGTNAPYFSLVYNANGLAQIVEVHDVGTSRYTEFSVDMGRNLVAITDPDRLSTRFGYDANARLETVTDRADVVSRFVYDPFSWKIAQTVMPQVQVDAGSGSTVAATPTTSFYPWQPIGVPTDPTSSSSKWPSASPGGVIAWTRDPKYRLVTFSVDRFGQPTATTDELGRTTTVKYSGILPVKVRYPDQSTDTLTYNSAGFLERQQRSGSDPIEYTYGPKGQIASVGGEGARTEVHTFTNGKVTKIAYDADQAEYVEFTYDPATQRVDTARDQKRHATVYRYDPVLGNNIEVIAPGNRTSTWTFDASGRTKTSGYTGGSVRSFDYDLMNRLIEESDGVHSSTTTIAYDAYNATDLRDANGNVYHTDYNPLGWATRECDPLGRCKTARYNVVGELTSATNRRGQMVSFTRDIIGRVTKKTGPAIADSIVYVPGDTVLVTMNATQLDSTFIRVGTFQDSVRDSTITVLGGNKYSVTHYYPMSFDGTYTTVIGSTSAQFLRRGFAVNAKGKVSKMFLGADTTNLVYNSDALDSLDTYPLNSGSRSSSYVDLHALKQRTFSDATLDTTFRRSYHYDAIGRIDKFQRPLQAGGSGVQTVFSYDLLGQLKTRELRTGCIPGSNDSTSGIGDSCGSQVLSESFDYDPVGNRKDRNAVVGPGNRYQSFNNASYTYDFDGNVTQKYDPTRLNREYSWTADNRLETATENSSSQVKYEYGVSGRPVRKLRKTVQDSTWRGDSFFLWDGEQLIAEFDSAGTRRSDYAYFPGIDQPYAQSIGASYTPTVRLHQQDELGNVMGTSESGVSSQVVEYDAWGTPTISGNADSRVLWKGLMWEGDAVSLYYMRARWYDSESGRFVSEDPLGLSGGANLYAFAENDPINFSDPSGLCIAADPRKCPAYRLPGVSVSAERIPGCEPGMETNVNYCDMARARFQFFLDSQQEVEGRGAIRMGNSGAGGSNNFASKILTKACGLQAANLGLMLALDYASWGQLGKAVVYGKSGRVILQAYEQGIRSNFLGIPTKSNTAAAITRPIAAWGWSFGFAGSSAMLTGSQLNEAATLLGVALPFVGSATALGSTINACLN